MIDNKSEKLLKERSQEISLLSYNILELIIKDKIPPIVVLTSLCSLFPVIFKASGLPNELYEILLNEMKINEPITPPAEIKH